MISRAQIERIVEIYRAQNANNAQKSLGAIKEIARDEIDLPFNQADLEHVRNIVQELPDVRTDRIQDCADKVLKGKYAIDSRQVADKMLGRLFADRIR